MVDEVVVIAVTGGPTSSSTNGHKASPIKANREDVEEEAVEVTSPYKRMLVSESKAVRSIGGFGRSLIKDLRQIDSSIWKACYITS